MLSGCSTAPKTDNRITNKKEEKGSSCVELYANDPEKLKLYCYSVEPVPSETVHEHITSTKETYTRTEMIGEVVLKTVGIVAVIAVISYLNSVPPEDDLYELGRALNDLGELIQVLDDLGELIQVLGDLAEL